MLHLLDWLIGSRGFSSLERRPEFWILHLGARPGSGKPQTQYPPQREVKERVFDAGPHGHPNQAPYVITWESLALDPPPWVAPFVTKKPRVPNTTAMVPTAPPGQSSHYLLLEKEIRGQTKASPPTRGPGLD